MQTNQSKEVKIIQILSTIVGLIVISMLILGGSLLAGKRWDPRWNPFNPNIKNIQSNTQQN